MLQPGQLIGDMYRIERMLGSGGMADVYLVKHTRLPKQFALKVLRLESGERTDFLERFRREAEILATLKHPHLVEIFDRNEMSDGNPYLVMELLEGEDLAQFLARTGGPLSVSIALSICQQIGDALHAAHQVGIVHRDLKPSNIFLCQREAFPNFVKVLDFGIAKQTQVERTSLTAERSLMGTPGYMAPEQALGKISQIDHRTDQFALAAILYEMLSGKPAFHQPEDTTFAILTRVVNAHPDPLQHPLINRAVQRALSKTTEARFSSIKDFLNAVGGTSLTIHMAPNTAEGVKSTINSGEVTVLFRRQDPPRGRFPLAGGVLGGVFGVGLAVAFVRWLSQEPHQLSPISVPSQPETAEHPKAPSSLSGGALAPPSTTNPAAQPGPDERLKSAGEPPEKPEAGVSRANPTATNGPATNSLKSTKRPAPAGTHGPSARAYNMSGLLPAQERLLQQCATKELNNISGLNNEVIRLERSGALQITEAPSAVYGTNFANCIRKIFTHGEVIVPIPQAVTIRIRGGR